MTKYDFNITGKKVFVVYCSSIYLGGLIRVFSTEELAEKELEEARKRPRATAWMQEVIVDNAEFTDK